MRYLSLYPSLLIVSLLNIIGNASAQHSIKYSGNMPLRPSVVAYGNTCVTFEGYVTADRFFVGLISEDTREKVRFRKGSTNLETFPPKMQVEVDANSAPCPNSEFVGAFCGLPYFIKVLDFKAQWANKYETRTANLTSISAQQEPWTELKEREVFRFNLLSTNIPLTEELVISVRLNGKAITELRGAVSVDRVRHLISRPQTIYRMPLP